MGKAVRSKEYLYDVAMRIRLIRKYLGITQQKFGQMLDVQATAVTNWERGTRLPDVKSIIYLAETYSITTDWILRGEPSGLSSQMARNLMGPTFSFTENQSDTDDDIAKTG